MTVTDFLSHLNVGKPKVHLNLAMFPILDRITPPPDYLTLDEALARMTAAVTETCEEGRVPELMFANSGSCRVFLLDGEELVGAKQNRVLNLSIMVPAGKTIVIPVSCVEHGRWNYRSGRFHASAQAHHSVGRAKRVRQVTACMMSTGRRQSDQFEVWDDIDRKFEQFKQHSETSAMADVYDSAAADLEDYVRSMKAAARQVGAVFAIDGSPVGLDVFDSARTFEKLSAKLVRSYALDALGELRSRGADEKGFPVPPRGDIDAFLGSVMHAELRTFPGTGEGEDVRLTGNNMSGAALVVDGRIVHLNAFVTS